MTLFSGFFKCSVDPVLLFCGLFGLQNNVVRHDRWLNTNYFCQIWRFQMVCGFSKCSVGSVVLFCGLCELQNNVVRHARCLKNNYLSQIWRFQMFSGFFNCSVGPVLWLCGFCGLQNDIVRHDRWLKTLSESKMTIFNVMWVFQMFCGLSGIVLWVLWVAKWLSEACQMPKN